MVFLTHSVYIHVYITLQWCIPCRWSRTASTSCAPRICERTRGTCSMTSSRELAFASPADCVNDILRSHNPALCCGRIQWTKWIVVRCSRSIRASSTKTHNQHIRSRSTQCEHSMGLPSCWENSHKLSKKFISADKIRNVFLTAIRWLLQVQLQNGK